MSADLKLTVWVSGIAVLLAVLVPDFSIGAVSILVIQLLVPLAIAGPIAYAVAIGRVGVLNGAGLELAGVVFHSGASAAFYRVSAGYGAFHDGVTMPVLWASFALKALAAFVILLCGLVFRWFAKQGQGAA